jgi:hypothetical protein
MSLSLQFFAFPPLPIIAAAVGWFHDIEKKAVPPDRGFHPGQALYILTPPLPFFTDAAEPFAAVQIHF